MGFMIKQRPAAEGHNFEKYQAQIHTVLGVLSYKY